MWICHPWHDEYVDEGFTTCAFWADKLPRTLPSRGSTSKASSLSVLAQLCLSPTGSVAPAQPGHPDGAQSARLHDPLGGALWVFSVLEVSAPSFSKLENGLVCVSVYVSAIYQSSLFLHFFCGLLVFLKQNCQTVFLMLDNFRQDTTSHFLPNCSHCSQRTPDSMQFSIWGD